MRKINLFLILIFSALITKSQSAKWKALSIGDSCPDINFTNFVNYDKNSAQVSDFKGKIILLDFFGTNCVPCVKSLPKMDSLQRKFRNDLQIIIICTEDKQRIQEFLKRLRKKAGFSVPFLTEDTTFYQYFKHNYVPFNVIIDRDGVVRAMPPENEVNESNIALFIKGIDPKLSVVKYEEEGRGDIHKALLIEPKANDEGLVIYHSILTSYLAMLPSGFFQKEYKDTSIRARITVMNGNIAFLYQMAFGNFREDDPSSFITWDRVVIESKDSSKLQRPRGYNFDLWKLNNDFCYDLILPNSFRGDAHDVMKSDLDRLYNYDVKLEKRKTKCFVFRRSAGADKLIRGGGREMINMNAYYLKMQNSSWNGMLYWLENKYLFDLPIVDETGFDRVTLDINADLTDFISLSRALKPIGIDLVVEDREVDMMVIRDKFNDGKTNN